MAISIWHWVMLGILIGIPTFACLSTSRRVNSEGEPEGIGGWLMLLAIGQTLAPLRTISEIGEGTAEYKALMGLPNGAIAAYAEIGLLLALAVLQLVVTVALFKKSPRFPRFFVYQWFAITIFSVIDILIVSALLHLPVDALLAPDLVARTVGAVIVGGICVWYLVKSVRVRNTFHELARSF